MEKAVSMHSIIYRQQMMRNKNRKRIAENYDHKAADTYTALSAAFDLAVCGMDSFNTTGNLSIQLAAAASVCAAAGGQQDGYG